MKSPKINSHGQECMNRLTWWLRLTTRREMTFILNFSKKKPAKVILKDIVRFVDQNIHHMKMSEISLIKRGEKSQQECKTDRNYAATFPIYCTKGVSFLIMGCHKASTIGSIKVTTKWVPFHSYDMQQDVGN